MDTQPLPLLELERGPCFGRCPIYKVALYADGAVVYRGGMFVAVQGTVTDHVGPESVAKLVDFAERSGFFNLVDRYPLQVFDVPSVTITVRSASCTKTVFMEGELEHRMPWVFVRLGKRIDQLAGVQRWIGD